MPGFGISSWDGSITHPVLSSEHPCAAVCCSTACLGALPPCCSPPRGAHSPQPLSPPQAAQFFGLRSYGPVQVRTPKFQPNSQLKQAAPGRRPSGLGWLRLAASHQFPAMGGKTPQHAFASCPATACLEAEQPRGGLCPPAAPCPPQVPAPWWVLAAALTPLTLCGLAGCSGGVSWESQEGKSCWGLCDRSKGSPRSKGSHRGCSPPTPHATLCPLPSVYGCK